MAELQRKSSLVTGEDTRSLEQLASALDDETATIAREDWDELQDSIEQWRAATRAFLQGVNAHHARRI